MAISGGDNGGAPPTMADDDLVTIAKGAGAIVVNLEQVPNQPLTFAGHDGKPHEEDGIITVLNPGGGAYMPGASCGLGKFVPVSKEDVTVLKQQLKAAAKP